MMISEDFGPLPQPRRRSRQPATAFDIGPSFAVRIETRRLVRFEPVVFDERLVRIVERASQTRAMRRGA